MGAGNEPIGIPHKNMLPSASVVARDASVEDKEAMEWRKKEVILCWPSLEKNWPSNSSALKQGLDAETQKPYPLLKAVFLTYETEFISLSFCQPLFNAGMPEMFFAPAINSHPSASTVSNQKITPSDLQDHISNTNCLFL